jgi:transcriptional regulator with GAF, ATPase, and Fis domain
LWGATLLKRSRQQTAMIRIEPAGAPTEEQELSLEFLVDRYLQLFIDITGVERASLMLLDPKHRKLKIYAAKGQRVYPFSGASFPKGRGIAGQSLLSKESIWVSHWQDTSVMSITNRVKHWVGGKQEEPLKSLACVPLTVEGKAIGVLNLSNLNQVKQFEISEMEQVRDAANRFSKILQDRIRPSVSL